MGKMTLANQELVTTPTPMAFTFPPYFITFLQFTPNRSRVLGQTDHFINLISACRYLLDLASDPEFLDIS